MAGSRTTSLDYGRELEQLNQAANGWLRIGDVGPTT
jgi:hypothetical protein